MDRVSDQYRHWVQFLGAAARDLSLRVDFQCRFSYHVPGRKTPSYLLAYLPCLHSPLVRLHASTSVCTLQIPNTGNHAIVWTHENTAHTLIGMGSAVLAAAVWLTQARRPEFPTRDCEVLKKEKKFLIPTCLRPEAIQQQTKEGTWKCPPAEFNWELHADLLPGSLSDWETGEPFCPESSPRQLLLSRRDATEFLRPRCPTAESLVDEQEPFLSEETARFQERLSVSHRRWGR